MQYLEFASNGTLHGMLKAYLFELERKNNIAEKQLELQREIFEFNKELDQRNTVANENVVATTQKMTDELLSAFKKNFDLITTNQGVLFTEIKKLNQMIEQQNKDMDAFVEGYLEGMG